MYAYEQSKHTKGQGGRPYIMNMYSSYFVTNFPLPINDHQTVKISESSQKIKWWS